MRKVIVTVLTVILMAVFCVSAYQVGSYFVDSKKQKDLYNDLSSVVQDAQQQAQSTTPPAKETEPDEATGATGTESTEETEPVMLPGYAELYEMNNDLVGWIRIEGTEIDYPVMQTPSSPNFYLKRNFNKEDSARGCIYIREECDVYAPSDNVTIYGHNMKDGSMFAFLHQYADKEVWEENKIILFDTLYEKHTYEIFSVFLTTTSIGEGFAYHQMVDAQTEEDFDEFIANCKSRALYDTGITPEYGDKIICLSTCEYTQINGRLVVAARRVD